MDARIENAWIHADFAGPDPNRLGHSKGIHKNRISFVVGLLNWGGPSAIPWFVIPVRIISFYGMFIGWLGPHVQNEIAVIEPALADSNATTAISFIERGTRISASAKHVSPCSILRSFLCIAAIVTMLQFVFIPQAAARLNASSSKVSGNSSSFTSAIAMALPAKLASIGFPDQFGDYQIVESKAENILKFSVVHAFIVTGGARAS